jgi:lysozyme
MKDMLVKHEGVELKPYRDSVGVLTIGVGRNLTDVGLSADEADYLLENDIRRATRELEMKWWFKSLDDVRQDVLINMCFNLGHSRFSKFKKMIAAVAMADYKLAAKEMIDSKWASQVGRRATELASMMESGKYPNARGGV